MAKKTLWDLASADTSLKRASVQKGGEYTGACPKCGGTDRFHVLPYFLDGKWFCRQCSPLWGNVYGYLVWRDGISYREAKSIIDEDKPLERKRDLLPPPPPIALKEVKPLTEWLPALPVWEQRLRDNKLLLSYLASRGIKTLVETYRLGFTGDDPTLEWKYRNRLVIPHFRDEKLMAIKMRLHPEKQGMKYISMSGSDYSLPFNADILKASLQYAGTIETEMDAIALHELTMFNIFTAIPAGAAKLPSGEFACTSFKQSHADLFMGVAHPFCIIDRDASGFAFAAAFKFFIKRARVIIPPLGYKDFGEWFTMHPSQHPKWLRYV